jgi:hypothetical protein
MKRRICATKILGLHFLPGTLEHWLNGSGHDATSADPENRELSIAKIFVPGVIAEEHETIRANQQLAIDFLAHH